jgi:hypothetical protein
LTNTIFAELDISEVLYNPKLTPGQTSGVAFKRLLTPTLNAVANIKNNLSFILPNLIYSYLQISNQNGTIANQAEIPTVKFSDAIVRDDTETIQKWTDLYRNKLATKADRILRQALKRGDDETRNYTLIYQIYRAIVLNLEGLEDMVSLRRILDEWSSAYPEDDTCRSETMRLRAKFPSLTAE